MGKKPFFSIQLAKVKKPGKIDSEGNLIKPAKIIEEDILNMKKLSKGDPMVYSPHDKRFHYKFKERGKELFVQRTNHKSGNHVDLKVTYLRHILKRIL